MFKQKNVEPEIKYNFQFNVGDGELMLQTNNTKIQLETKLEDEIEELKKLMEKVNKPRYCKLKQNDNNVIYLTARVYNNKEGGELHHKVWNPRRREKTTT